MEHRPIPQTQIPHTSRLFHDFLYDFARVRQFYPLSPFAPESFQTAAQSLNFSDERRAALLRILRQQQERYSARPETTRNMDRLAQPGCYAVVTGQQVGLFGGPAFTLYKALTAIKLANRLTERGMEAVPVFWLATEDHDLNEVNHCFVQDRGGKPARLEYSQPAAVPNAPVGIVPLNETIHALCETLGTLLPDSPEAKELCQQVKNAYAPGETLGSSFARLLENLFSRFGVVLVEASDPDLHRLAGSVFRVAIECATEILDELRTRNRQLTEAGYHAQVHLKENATLLFLYEDGRRTALRSENGRSVSTLGRSYEKAELLAMLEDNPALFSPNALLRPVMQDAVLPTVAYVGGPSELAYLAQSAPLYERILGRMPVMFPRASFTVLDAASRRLLGKYDLTLHDVFAGRQTLREKMAARYLPEGLTQLFEKAASNLNADVEAIRRGLQHLDPTLADAAANSLQKMQYQLSNLERKAAAAVQQRTDQVEKDAARLENSLYPEKTLQERFYSGISLLARFGLPLLNQLYEQISLDSADHRVLIPGNE